MIIDLIFPYTATTRFGTGSLTVRVAPRYLPDQSDPQAPRHVWSYHIRVENHALETVQLVARHWRITDAHGQTESIDGEGVIGQQPVIPSGAAFDYVSGCPLATPSGVMEGHYDMICESGPFRANIPPFALEHPGLKPRLQ
nr:Co2+/Mg2+ efflux protein ApaG [Polymorphobacter sp.]